MNSYHQIFRRQMKVVSTCLLAENRYFGCLHNRAGAWIFYGDKPFYKKGNPLLWFGRIGFNGNGFTPAKDEVS